MLYSNFLSQCRAKFWIDLKVCADPSGSVSGRSVLLLHTGKETIKSLELSFLDIVFLIYFHFFLEIILLQILLHSKKKTSFINSKNICLKIWSLSFCNYPGYPRYKWIIPYRENPVVKSDSEKTTNQAEIWRETVKKLWRL